MKKTLIILTLASTSVFAQRVRCPLYGEAYKDCATGTIQLSATPGFDLYSWSPAGPLSNPNISNPTTGTPGTYTVTASTLGSELVVNGDFSAGNSGFTSGMTYSSVYSPCNYFVGPGWFSSVLNPVFPDHTATTDNMFMSLDGCSPATIIWEETMSVGAGANYNFSFWSSRADYIQPNFEIHFIGNVTGDVVVGTQAGIPYTGVWTWDQYGIPLWNAGLNTSVTIRIVNLETNPTGNDFGLDDFSFRKIVCTNSFVVNANTNLGMNLFTNGDFSAGNVGFFSGHTYAAFYNPCYYYVGPGWFSATLDPNFPDHTLSSDNMFMSVDGCAPATILWEQTILISPATVYNFEFWASRADFIQPNFEIHFIGDVSGDNIVSTQTGIPYTGVWTWDPYGVPCWYSDRDTKVTVRIINLETNPTGNDFGLDDFSFRQCCSADECCNKIPNGRLAGHTETSMPVNFSVYPNPGNGNFTVQLEQYGENVQAEIVNLLGEVIDGFTFSGNGYKYSPEQKLPAGIYLLRITQDGVQTTQRIVIE